MMNQYCSFDFYKKKKKWFLTYLLPECKEKCELWNNSINVLDYATLNIFKLRPKWTRSIKNRTFTMLMH